MSGSSTYAAVSTPAGTRSTGSVVMTALAVTVLCLVGLQFVLAAYGAFGGGYDAHGALGRAVPAAAGLLLVTAIVCRCRAQVIALGGLLVVLAGPAAFLLAGSAGGNPEIGALHGLNAVLVAVTAVMMLRAGRTAGQR